MRFPSVFRSTAVPGAERRPASATGPVAAALVAAGIGLALAAPAVAQSTTRTRILDACVYDLYFEQRSSENVTKRCQCATRKLENAVSDEEAASYRVGSRLTGSLREKVYEALSGC